MNDFFSWGGRGSTIDAFRDPLSPENRPIDLHLKEFVVSIKAKKEKTVREGLTQMVQYLNFVGETNVSSNLSTFLEETIPLLSSCLERFDSPETTLKVLSCVYLVARNVPNVFKKPFMVTRKNEPEEQHLIALLCAKLKNSSHLDILEKILNVFDIIASKNPEKILENNVIFLVLDKFDSLDHANQTFMIHIMMTTFSMFSNLEIYDKHLSPRIPDLLRLLSNKSGMSKNDARKLWLCLAKRVVTLASYKNKDSIHSISRDEILEMILHLLKESVSNIKDPEKLKTIKSCFQTMSSLFAQSDKLTLSAFERHHIIENVYEIMTTAFAKQLSCLDEECYIPIIKEAVIFLNSILAIRGMPLALMQSLFQTVMDIKLADNPQVEHKLLFFKEHRHYLTKILHMFLPTLIDLFYAFPGIVFKYLLLFCIEKLITFADYQELERLADFRRLCQLLRTLLAASDVIMLAFGLHLVDTLVCKVMPVYGYLVREGIVQQLEKLENKTKRARWSIFGVPVEVVLKDQYMMQSEHPQPEKVYDVFYDEDKFLEFLVDHRRYFIESDHLYFEDFHASNIKHKVNLCNLSEISFLTNDNPFQSQKKKPANEHRPTKSISIPDFNVDKNALDEPDDQMAHEKEFRSEKCWKMIDVYERIVVRRMEQISFEIGSFARTIVTRFYKYSHYCKTTMDQYTKPLAKLITMSESFNRAASSDVGSSLFASFTELFAACDSFSIHEFNKSHFFKNIMEFLLCKVSQDDSSLLSTDSMANNPISSLKSRLSLPPDTTDMIACRLFNFYHFLDQKCPHPQFDTMERYFISLLMGNLPVQENSLTYHDSYEDRRYSEINSEVEKILESISLTLTFFDGTGLSTNLNKNLSPEEAKEQQLQQTLHQMSRTLLSRLIQSEEVTVVDPLKVEDLKECFAYKRTIFRDIRTVRLSVEKIQNLESLENYLLNKFYTPEDKSYGEDYGLYSFNIPEFINERYNEPRGRRRIVEYSENEIPNELPEQAPVMKMHYYSRPRNLLENRQKMPNPNPLEAPKIVRYGSLSYPTMITLPRRKAIDAKSERLLDFTQFLEVKFFLDDQELDKKQTLFQIIHRAKLSKISRGFASKSCWHDSIDLKFQLHWKGKYTQKLADVSLFSMGTTGNEYSMMTTTPNFMSVKCANDLPTPALDSLNDQVDQIVGSLIDKLEDVRRAEDGVPADIIWMSMFLRLITEIRSKAMAPLFTSTALPLYPLISRKRQLFPINFVHNAFNSKKAAPQLVSPQGQKPMTTLSLPPPLQGNIHYLLGSNIFFHLIDTLVIVAEGLPCLSDYIINKLPGLVPLEVRKRCFKIYKMPLLRRLHYFNVITRQKKREHEALRIFTITKKKLKVERLKVLENAYNHFDTVAGQPTAVEFQFVDEEGIGNGPTQEYFTTVCEELRKNEYGLWRKTNDHTLFPAPIDPHDTMGAKSPVSLRKIPPSESTRRLETSQLVLKMLGMFVATGILEDKTLDLPINPVFWKIVLDEPVYLQDIQDVDKELGTTLMDFAALAAAKKEIECDQSIPAREKRQRIEALRYKGAAIDDLALTFTFPGYDTIELKDNGAEILVTIDNLDEYVRLLTRFFLCDTLQTQVKFFREGFEKVFPLSTLKIFAADEIEYLYSDKNEDRYWTPSMLEEYVTTSYGYTNESKAYKTLLTVMSEFTPEDRKLFLKFVTGASRLPFGGFRSLNPKLSVAKRVCGPDTKVDFMYPSVMTCQNFLKLPDYSSIDIMRKRLLVAIRECQNNFSLT